MPQLVWRIAPDTPGYSAHDLTGLGAQASGGRWNRKGTPLVYASLSRALACLETIVHLAGFSPLPLNRYLVGISIEDESWEARTIFDSTAHLGWNALPAGLESLDWGTKWANSANCLVAEVPSIVVPEESNVLLNPRHPEAMTLRAKKLRRWTYDGRLRSL
jgi:RES domain-containing protein